MILAALKAGKYFTTSPRVFHDGFKAGDVLLKMRVTDPHGPNVYVVDSDTFVWCGAGMPVTELRVH